MSLVSLLSIARSALLTHQRAMTVTGNNVANAQTPGYSRQRLELTEAVPLRTTYGSLGRGVDGVTISRARDRFFDAAYRRESGLLGQSATQSGVLSQVEAALGEPSNQGLGAALDGLFSSFTDLVNDPSSGVSRSLTRQAAVRLVDQLHQTDARISQLVTDASGRLSEQVTQVNQLTRQIAGLNAEILASGPNGSPALEDQRDLAIDQLSGLLSIQVVQHDDGTVGVHTGGAMLLDRAASRDLVVRSTATGPGVGFVTGAGVIDTGGGSIKSLVGLTNTSLPAVRAQLDKLTLNLVTQVNNIHRAGFNLAGGFGINFFAPTGTKAATIQISDEVLASTDAIATGDTPGTGDGGVAQRLGDLIRFPLVGLGKTSLRDYYINVTSTLGITVSDAQRQTDINQTLVDNAESQRQQVSGVSVDEEMIQLITQQQAYGAAARLVGAADQMMQTVLQMLG